MNMLHRRYAESLNDEERKTADLLTLRRGPQKLHEAMEATKVRLLKIAIALSEAHTVRETLMQRPSAEAAAKRA
jgi:hypothetical protein